MCGRHNLGDYDRVLNNYVANTYGSPWDEMQAPLSDDGHAKCSASNALSMYPIIVLLVMQLLTPLGVYTEHIE